jgi:hypothetical protein
VYLKVSPMKGVKRFGMKGKFAPRHIRPFPILEKCGTVEYKLELPPSLAGVHGIFHASHLKKYLKSCYSTNPTYIRHVLCVVVMVTCSMNRSIGSQVGTATINSIKHVPLHCLTIITILLLRSSRFLCC